MFNCEKITEITELMRTLIKEYYNCFSKLENSIEIYYTKKMSSKRSIHNISYSIRPDFMSFNSCLCFFDWSFSWQNKRQNTYTICFNKDQRISCIYTGKKSFMEFFVYKNNMTILLGYSKQEEIYRLESVGIGRYDNGRIVEFSVAELENMVYPSHGFRLKSEEYLYCNDKIVNVISYDYIANVKLTNNPNNPSEFGCINMKSGAIYANPEIYIDDYIYDDKTIKVLRRNLFKVDIPPAEIIIRKKVQ